jgi:hypothetical protein
MPDTNAQNVPPNNNVVDVNGLLQVQKDYLTVLKDKSQDPNSAPIVSNIQTNLTATYNDYNAANVTTDGLLTHQNEVLDIIGNEKKRLEDKKNSVDTVIFGQKRAVELNNSNRLKQNAYNYLIVIFLITLGAFIAIILLSRYLTIVPQIVYDLLSIIVISVGIYFIVLNFFDIQSRSNMNFNELDLAPLPNAVAGNTVAKSSSDTSSDLLQLINVNGCVGAECCGPNTLYDQSNNICILRTGTGTGTATSTTRAPFTTMDFAYKVGELPNKKISVNTPYEFTNYVPIR